MEGKLVNVKVELYNYVIYIIVYEILYKYNYIF